MEFLHAYNSRGNPRSHKTAHGCDDVPEYKGFTKADGGRERRQVGSYSQTEYVQSWLDSVLLSKILERASITKDYSAIVSNQGYFLDTTKMPNTFEEVQNGIVLAKSYYNSLPDNVREKYASFSVFSDAFLSGYDTKEFQDLGIALGFFKAPVDVTTVGQEVSPQ